MINHLLQKKSMLQSTPLFDSSYFAKAHCDNEVNDSVSTEVRYLNEKSLWFLGTSGLFNGQYYAFASDDVRELSYPPIIHYITNGYYEARRPSALVDIDYIVAQITGEELPAYEQDRHALKIKVLGEFDGIYDLLKTTKVNPNRLFNNEYFIEKNKLSGIDIDIPVQYFYSNNSRHPETQKMLETTPMFSMSKYLEENKDILDASVNPLEHLLTHGLREGRLACFKDLISEFFLKNTAELYDDHKYVQHEYFLAKSDDTGQIAGPKWQSRYRKQSHPAFNFPAEKYADSVVTIGTVLYENTNEELRRLKASIAKEVEASNSVEIRDIYFVNDAENLERYQELFGEDKVILSPKGNVGFGSGHNYLMNQGFQESDYYFGVNPDGYLIRNCIQMLVGFSKYYKDASLIEANTLPVGHPKWHDPVMFDTNWVSGVAFFLSKAIWKDIGGFDEEIHMYSEDVDFSWRVKAAGYALKVCPAASFYHDVTGRFTKPEDEEVDRKRRKSMLMGAYHLSMKWQASEEAEKYKQMMVTENLLLPNQEIAKPSSLIPKSVASGVADFGYDLRFAPSRYW